MLQNHLPSKNVQKQMTIQNSFKCFVTYADKPDKDPTLWLHAFTNWYSVFCWLLKPLSHYPYPVLSDNHHYLYMVHFKPIPIVLYFNM